MTECHVDHLSKVPVQVPDPASVNLADHTTLRVGGPAKKFLVAHTADDVARIVTECDESGEPLLILGGGSNMLVSDEGFDGTVLKIGITGVDADVSNCGGAVARVGAGENWDDFVAYTIEQGWSGAEALSGIPGSVGATPVQNVGAYGTDVSHFIYSVRTFDRETKQFKTFPAVGCEFGYRQSRFKREPARYVVVQVVFQFPLGLKSAPIRYGELASKLGVQVGDRADAQAAREAVLEIRRSKGMVLDDSDHDSWSAGSFFMNPILEEDAAERLPENAPRFPDGKGKVKSSAAWLIQNSGFGKGHRRGNAGLSTKHVLALTNRGGASAQEIVELAREVREGVEKKMGVRLVPEVNLVGVSL